MNEIPVLSLSALALALSIGSAPAVVNPDELPQVACSDLKFSAAFLAKYPRAPQACQDAQPGPNQHVLVNGREKAFHDLAVGEKITIWVSEKRLQASKMPGSKEDQWAVLPPLEK